MPRLWREFYGRRWRLWLRTWTNRVAALAWQRALLLRACANVWRTCCPTNAQTQRLRITLIQCLLPFRTWRRVEGVPLGQFHSDSYDLAEHLSVLRVAQDPNRDGGQWMRLQNDLLAAHAAPAAGVAVASLHKINRTFVFGAPRSFHYLISGFIDLDETAGRQDGIHGEIIGADITIGEIGIGELREIRS